MRDGYTTETKLELRADSSVGMVGREGDAVQGLTDGGSRKDSRVGLSRERKRREEISGLELGEDDEVNGRLG